MIKRVIFRDKYLILGLVLAIGLFYWFQLRPAQIRHDCSWVERHLDAVPAEPGLTQEQIDKNCKEIVGNPWYKEMTCKMSPVSSKPAQPAKNWWGKATPDEYEFCLHEKGLLNYY